MTGSRATRLPSGRWAGYFVDNRDFGIGHEANSRWPIDVYVTFSPNGREFSADGTDEIGTFKFTHGTISDECFCQFLKTYETHSVTYQGLIYGHLISGMWWLTDHPWISGTFSMYPHWQTLASM
ncbi:uncharacterized protein [Ptychodera flava]|uniref:uncharacterized protein isoform X2 n=1 Tax=Ptychodera flava TaxID=63121 RepID=UPI00396AAF42